MTGDGSTGHLTDTHVVWAAEIDGRTWQVTVTTISTGTEAGATAGHDGRMRIIHQSSGWCALDLPVIIEGVPAPSAEEIADWRRMVIDWIDHEGEEILQVRPWGVSTQRESDLEGVETLLGHSGPHPAS